MRVPDSQNRGPRGKGTPGSLSLKCWLPASVTPFLMVTHHARWGEGTWPQRGLYGDLEARRHRFGAWLFYLVAVETEQITEAPAWVSSLL